MKFQRFARILANSSVFEKAHKLWLQNQQNWNLPLSKIDKLFVGLHVILNDYAQGQFPPTFPDQQKAYDAEINYHNSLPGFDSTEVADAKMRKPFWFGKNIEHYLRHIISLKHAFEQIGVKPPQKLLELGGGAGWMAEFLTLMRFDVVSTTISPFDTQIAQLRLKSLQTKQLDISLDFRTSPMETIDQAVKDRIPFDCVFVFEALHHAYDWRKACESSYSCLSSGGWLVIANEPNRVHTYSSYRVAKLSNTHEIGFKRSELMSHLKQIGFHNVTTLKNSIGLCLFPHWIAAQK